MAISLNQIEKWEKKKKGKKLLRALNEENVEIRIRAIRALAAIDDPEIINPLVNMLRDPVPGIRLASVETLGKIGSSRAMEFIRYMMENENDEKVLEAAKIALNSIKEKIKKADESA
jgi:HEAT repeat protein